MIYVLIGLIVAFLLVWFIIGGTANVISSIAALLKPPIDCPACGRKISIIGSSTKCYKCRTRIIKHQNGSYVVPGTQVNEVVTKKNDGEKDFSNRW